MEENGCPIGCELLYSLWCVRVCVCGLYTGGGCIHAVYILSNRSDTMVN